MEELLYLLSMYRGWRVSFEDWVLQLNKEPKDQRELITSKFMKHLIKNEQLDINWYEWEYEFLLDTLSKWDLIEFICSRIRFSLIKY